MRQQNYYYQSNMGIIGLSLRHIISIHSYGKEQALKISSENLFLMSLLQIKLSFLQTCLNDFQSLIDKERLI